MSKKAKTKIKVRDTAMLPNKAKEVKGGSFSWGAAPLGANTMLKIEGQSQFLKLDGGNVNFYKE